MGQETRRSASRMPSAVRVRRHNSSRFLDFIERHGIRRSQDQGRPTEGELNSTESTSVQSSPTPIAAPRRPGLGSKRRSSGAVEQLIMSDRRASYGEIPSSSDQPSTNTERMGGSRATDGRISGLARVSEDVSPLSPHDIAYPEINQPGQDGTATDILNGGETSQDYFATTSSTDDSAESSLRPPQTPHSVGGSIDSNATTSRFNISLPSTASTERTGTTSTRGSNTRFLIPTHERGSTKATPDRTSPTSSRSGRLHRIRSNVSIPTPVLEEDSHPLHQVEDDDDFDDINHTDDVADYLDVVDPEVGALGYLSNIGNSIFLPHIPALYDRRPTHNLPSSRNRGQSFSSALSRRRSSVGSSRSRRSQGSGGAMEEGRIPTPLTDLGGEVEPTRSRSVITRMSSAVGLGKKDDDEEFVKHIKKWRDMDEEERDELDEHVKMLLTKKSKFKRGLKGFYAFVKTPMGFIMTLYGLLVTFWGTAIVLFIFGWIHVGHRKRYWIEICDQILCALFAAVGLGFAPFRAVDTYRMIHIAHYHHLTWKRRKALGLNDLNDPNDLPRPDVDGSNQVSRADEVVDDGSSHLEKKTTLTMLQSNNEKESKHSLIRHPKKKSKASNIGHKLHKKVILPSDVEEREMTTVNPIVEDPTGRTGDLSQGRVKSSNSSPKPVPPQLKRNESIQSELIKPKEDIVVLTKGEQASLSHHQRKFHSSHTFYRFHETATHHAFPLDLMIVITCLLDCHSLLQGALGGCTWGIKYTHRPTALTATIITCSLSCNAVAGLIIWLGGRRTKKREEVERRLKIALEAEAFAKIERRRARGELPIRRNDGSQSSDEDAEGHLEGDGERQDDKLDLKAAHEKRKQLAEQLGLNNDGSEKDFNRSESSPDKL